jgi:hypothetical protein
MPEGTYQRVGRVSDRSTYRANQVDEGPALLPQRSAQNLKAPRLNSLFGSRPSADTPFPVFRRDHAGGISTGNMPESAHLEDSQRTVTPNAERRTPNAKRGPAVAGEAQDNRCNIEGGSTRRLLFA